MSDGLNFALPTPKPQPAGGGMKAVIALLVCVLVVGAANIVVSLRGSGGGSAKTSPANLPDDAQKELAMKLEKQGLQAQAAAAWREYLDRATLTETERGGIWYRVGKLYQDSGDQAQALASYYRAESFGATQDLQSDLNRRTEECLEALGKFAALKYELADRVSLDKTKADTGDDVVAEIGPQRITRAELDRRIEAEVDRQLEQYAAYLPEEQRLKQKEQILKSVSSDQGRLQMLGQIVGEEILYRKAVDQKLGDDPGVRDTLNDMQRKVLAQKVLDKELSTKINITPGDLQTYYDANKADYVRPERAHISHILVEKEEEAAQVLDRLKNGEAFDVVAKERSMDAATKEAGGAIEAWVLKGEPVPGMGKSEEASPAIFSAEAGKVVEKPIKTEKGYEVIQVREREPEYQQPISEVQQQVYQTLRKQKETEVREQLLAGLQKEYDVVIHQSKFGQKEEAKPSDVTKDNVVVVPADEASKPSAAPNPTGSSPQSNAPQNP